MKYRMLPAKLSKSADLKHSEQYLEVWGVAKPPGRVITLVERMLVVSNDLKSCRNDVVRVNDPDYKFRTRISLPDLQICSKLTDLLNFTGSMRYFIQWHCDTHFGK